MFTGIIEEIGRIVAVETAPDRARLAVSCGQVTADAALGSSIAVDGCCLTVAELRADGFEADLMAETVRATTLGSLAEGDPVNLERPLRADGRFGGHLVQGHVDGVGRIVEISDSPGTRMVTVEAPRGITRYLAAKGSITIAGASLTVVDLTTEHERAHFRVGLIPHTRQVTTLGELSAGDQVNLEADIVAKYVERMLEGTGPTP